MKKGVTLLELLVAIGIMFILFGISSIAFSTIQYRNRIENITVEIKSALSQAQTEAYNRKNSAVYFEPQRFVYFQGDVYVEGAPGNIETEIPSSLTLSEILLPSSIARFNSVTGYLEGYTDPSGIVLQDVQTGSTKRITINPWGVVTIQ